MVNAILPPIHPTIRCIYCNLVMQETHTPAGERAYECPRCGHTRHADTAERAKEALALAVEEQMTFEAAWELVETLADYAALWDARQAIRRRNAARQGAA